MTIEAQKAVEEMKGISADIAKNMAEFKSEVDNTKAELAKVQSELKKQNEAFDAAIVDIQKMGKKGAQAELTKFELDYMKKFNDLISGRCRASDMKAEMKDYHNYLVEVAQKNGDFRTVEELKLFSTDKIADGGALIPVQMANRIVEKQRDFSNVRAFASVERSDTTGLVLPGEGDDFGAAWVGERQSQGDTTTGTFFDIEIPVNEAKAVVPITNKMRMNSAFNMDDYITRKAAAKLARLEGNAFVVGNGDKKPKGFMAYAAGTGDGQVQQVETVASTSLGHKDLTRVKTPLRQFYRRNARYFFNRFTEGQIEELQDTANRPLFGLYGNPEQGIAPRLKGFPYEIFDDMDGANASTGSFAANALVALFGDLAQFYTIVDSTTAMMMFIDPYTGADEGKVKFRFNKFTGGGVSDFRAAIILKVKA